jgi:putative phosphoesterase
MRIGVISDTHDRLPTFEAALRRLAELEVQAILHAGDYVAPFAAKLLTDEHRPGPAELEGGVHGIYGNNDGERAGLKKVLPQLVDGPLRLELGGRVIVMHHYLDWLTPEDRAGADVVISGHDHRPAVATSGGQLLLNPGECCGWLSGRCTAAVLETDSLTAELIDVGHERAG